ELPKAIGRTIQSQRHCARHAAGDLFHSRRDTPLRLEPINLETSPPYLHTSLSVTMGTCWRSCVTVRHQIEPQFLRSFVYESQTSRYYRIPVVNSAGGLASWSDQLCTRPQACTGCRRRMDTWRRAAFYG